MFEAHRPTSGDVEQLLLNAQLRGELEPYLDESISLVNIRQMPTHIENEFLASMLAWERAPVLPVCEWFTPELVLPAPDSLGDSELQELLWDAIHKLYDKRIVLDFADHLSDRQLYCVLYRDILPSHEKKVDLPKNYLHWHCLDVDDDQDIWLRYYASRQEREEWSAENGIDPPPSQRPPYSRKMPRKPMG